MIVSRHLHRAIAPEELTAAVAEMEVGSATVDGRLSFDEFKARDPPAAAAATRALTLTLTLSSARSLSFTSHTNTTSTLRGHPACSLPIHTLPPPR